jgi:hypothetical protein
MDLKKILHLSSKGYLVLYSQGPDHLAELWNQAVKSVVWEHAAPYESQKDSRVRMTLKHGTPEGPMDIPNMVSRTTMSKSLRKGILSVRELAVLASGLFLGDTLLGSDNMKPYKDLSRQLKFLGYSVSGVELVKLEADADASSDPEEYVFDWFVKAY